MHSAQFLLFRQNSISTNTGGYRYFFNGQEGDNEVFGEVASFGYEFRQYDSRLGRWWSVDPKWNEYPNVSPFVFCNGSPVMLMDPDGKEVWHPDGEGSLIADNNDDFSTLQDYLSTIYGSRTAISEDNWNSYQNQILHYQNQNNTQDIKNMRLYSTDGTFYNLVGKYLMTMCQNDASWGLGPYSVNNCSPTTFMRIDMATEFVYGQDLLGDMSWTNPVYRAWQGDKKSAIKFGTEVVVDKQLGSLVENHEMDLKPGALLRLVGSSSWHSAIFIDYIYSDDSKIEFSYWDQNYEYIHKIKFNSEKTYKISKAVNFH